MFVCARLLWIAGLASHRPLSPRKPQRVRSEEEESRADDGPNRRSYKAGTSWCTTFECVCVCVWVSVCESDRQGLMMFSRSWACDLSVLLAQFKTRPGSRITGPETIATNWVQRLFTLFDVYVSSLRRGHANLLCIVPVLTDDPRRESAKLGATIPNLANHLKGH